MLFEQVNIFSVKDEKAHGWFWTVPSGAACLVSHNTTVSYLLQVWITMVVHPPGPRGTWGWTIDRSSVAVSVVAPKIKQWIV